jgi:hypothetical protein
LILRVTTAGGFIAPEAIVTNVPEFSLLGDGRVIVPGAVDAIFPGPAMAPLLVRTANEEGIQAVLRMVADTRLFTQDREFRSARVADGPTTTFTLHADGHEATVSFYALGTTQELPADESAAQDSLVSLEQRLTTLDSVLGASNWADAAWHAFQPTALRLFVRNADAEAPDPSGIGNQLIAWPTAANPETVGEPWRQQRCAVMTGADASGWLRALSQANQLTRFVAGGHRYEVRVRPLLPDEPRDCPSGN